MAGSSQNRGWSEGAERSIELLLGPYLDKRSKKPARILESDVRQISVGLQRMGKDSWAKAPRLYIVLRMVNQVDTLEAFLSEGISDLWFPFSHQTLPQSLRSASARFDFIELQNLVLTKAVDLEREDGKHRHFSRPEDIPLQKLEELGKGGFGFVDRVLSTITYREYARKLIPRGKTFKKNSEVLKDFERELNSLRKLEHNHIVKLVGSYTDPKFVGILMSPVADFNLKDFLTKSSLSSGERSFLRTFFGCLARALCYLHENRIRHKDIKPQNVLVKGHQVFLTDFGISLDWSEMDQSTTAGTTTKTPRYCSPEVAEFSPRNSLSDMWSLGCVFLEIWTVLKGEMIDAIFSYLQAQGTRSTCYCLNHKSALEWCQTLESRINDIDENPPARWIRCMLQPDQEQRWTAQTLVNHIQEANEDESVRYLFLGVCCIVADDSTDSNGSSKRSSMMLEETGASSVGVYEPKSSITRLENDGSQNYSSSLSLNLRPPTSNDMSRSEQSLNELIQVSEVSGSISREVGMPVVDKYPKLERVSIASTARLSEDGTQRTVKRKPVSSKLLAFNPEERTNTSQLPKETRGELTAPDESRAGLPDTTENTEQSTSSNMAALSSSIPALDLSRVCTTDTQEVEQAPSSMDNNDAQSGQHPANSSGPVGPYLGSDGAILHQESSASLSGRQSELLRKNKSNEILRHGPEKSEIDVSDSLLTTPSLSKKALKKEIKSASRVSSNIGGDHKKTEIEPKYENVAVDEDALPVQRYFTDPLWQPQVTDHGTEASLVTRDDTTGKPIFLPRETGHTHGMHPVITLPALDSWNPGRLSSPSAIRTSPPSGSSKGVFGKLKARFRKASEPERFQQAALDAKSFAPNDPITRLKSPNLQSEQSSVNPQNEPTAPANQLRNDYVEKNTELDIIMSRTSENMQHRSSASGKFAEPSKPQTSAEIPPKEHNTQTQLAGTPENFMCACCQQKCTGQFVRALDSIYHLDCFTCKDCGIIVADKFFPFDEDDGSGQVPLCETDYFSRLELLCHKCGRALRGSYITALEHKYHIEHFTCSVCTFGFSQDDSYYEHEGEIYCHYHYVIQFGRRCEGCSWAILKQFVEISNPQTAMWHPECYVIFKTWKVKLDLIRLDGPRPDSKTCPAAIERDALNRDQNVIEEKISRAWAILSGFEERFSSCISDIQRYMNSKAYAGGIYAVFELLMLIQWLFVAVDSLAKCIASHDTKVLAYANYAKILCKRLVGLLTLLANSKDDEVRQADLAKQFVNIKIATNSLIRVSLEGALKLQHDKRLMQGFDQFLDVLGQVDAVQCEIIDGTTLLGLAHEMSDCCDLCRQPIDNECVMMHGKRWHTTPPHFTCSICERDISHDFGAVYRSRERRVRCAFHAFSDFDIAESIIHITKLEQYIFLLKVALARLLSVRPLPARNQIGVAT